MATDSTQAGYLLPTDSPIHDDTLEDYFQTFIVGLTGLPGNMVRPRWPTDTANRPSAETNWIAFGLNVLEPQWNSYQKFHPEIGPAGAYLVEGNEVIEVNTSFYGPDHTLNRRNYQEGLQIEQNLWDLQQQQKMRFIHCLPPVNVPALLKSQWAMRSDVKVVFHRWVTRTYPIKTYNSATGSLNNERYVTPLSVTPPP